MSYNPRFQGYGANYYNQHQSRMIPSGGSFRQNSHDETSQQQHIPNNTTSSYPYYNPKNEKRRRTIGESSSEQSIRPYPFYYFKRRRLVNGESSSEFSDYVYNSHQNVLLELCQSSAWSAALQRWRSFPHEAAPVVLLNKKNYQQTTTPLKNGADDEKDASSIKFTLYQPTILGMICSSPSQSSGVGTEREESISSRILLLQEILHHCPTQVACSQVHVGHTPLRDAILSPRCSLEVLKPLLKADQENCLQHSENYRAASYQRDSQGLSPLDHLIMKLQSNQSTTIGQSSVDLLEAFLEMRPPAPKAKAARSISTTMGVSPLLRLLTVADPLPFAFPLNARASKEETAPRFYKIQEMIQCLLRQEPELLYVCSSATGCSPLHIAARKCNFLPIIRDLVSADTKNQLIRMANNFGDLPIHVVCSNGAELDVLRFLVSKTADHSCRLLWTPTGFGYTPADLLWLNHIEADSSFVKVRTFHAKYAATETRFQKDNEYYQKVLQESVNELVNGDRVCDFEISTLERMERAKKKFGGLLDSLFVLLSAVSLDGRTEPWKDGKHLHLACMVCTPYGHTLALPLFKLLLWIFNDDLLTADESGSIPLHHALGSNLLPFESPSNHKDDSPKKEEAAIEKQWAEWAGCCQDLIHASPESCGIVNQNGQLPLHLLLSHRPTGSNGVSQQLHKGLIEKMVEAFPESVHTRDPVSRMDPFMLASMADDPLDTIYNLLRQCPNLCHVNGEMEL